jgi:ankyrin repeat protein
MPGPDHWAHTAALGKAAEMPAVIRPVDEWKPVEFQRYALNPSPAPLYHATGTVARPPGTPSVQSINMMSQSQQSIHREIPSMHGLPPETSVEERPQSPSTPGGGGARFIQEEWNYDVVARGEELLESLVAGNFSRVDALLNGNWDVSVRHASTGDTVLHLVAKLAMSPLGLRILEHGSDVEARNAARETPLLLAVRHQRCYQLATALLKRHADPNVVAEDGTTPLLRAAESAGEDPSRLVELLLSMRANPDYRDPAGSSALHMCSVQGDARTAAVLLAAGANPKLTVGNGWVTPLYLATTRGHAHVVEVLSDFGASAP